MIELLGITLFAIATLFIAFEYIKEKIIEKEKTPFHERLKIGR